MTHLARVLAASILLAFFAGPMWAQSADPPIAEKADVKAATVPRDLQLETEKLQLKVEKHKLSQQVKGLSAQVSALTQIVNQLVNALGKPEADALGAERKALHDKIVLALGGDPAKGDALNAEWTGLAAKPPPEK